MSETDQFERFTERARRVLTIAQEEARSFNHNYLGTEHLLLAVARDRDMVSAQMLANLGVSLAAVRAAVESIIGRGDRSYDGEIGFTPRAKKVIDLARDEAKRLTHSYVGTEHLLLALALEGEGIAAGVLWTLGVDYDQLHHELTDRILVAQGPVERVRAKDNVVACRVDDQDLAAIDALVQAGVRSTRSDAAAWLIRMGIDANADLFEKVLSTANEIRRLRHEVLAAGLRQMKIRRRQSAAPAAENPPTQVFAHEATSEPVVEDEESQSGSAEPPKEREEKE